MFGWPPVRKLPTASETCSAIPFFPPVPDDRADFADVPLDVFELSFDVDFDCSLVVVVFDDLPDCLLAPNAGRFPWAPLFEREALVFVAAAFLEGEEVLFAAVVEVRPADEDPGLDARLFAEPPVDCDVVFSDPADDREPDAFSLSDPFLALPVVRPDAGDFVVVAI